MSQIERKKNPIVSATITMSIDTIPINELGLALPARQLGRTRVRYAASARLRLVKCFELLKRPTKLPLASWAMALDTRPRSQNVR